MRPFYQFVFIALFVLSNTTWADKILFPKQGPDTSRVFIGDSLSVFVENINKGDTRYIYFESDGCGFTIERPPTGVPYIQPIDSVGGNPNWDKPVNYFFYGAAAGIYQNPIGTKFIMSGKCKYINIKLVGSNEMVRTVPTKTPVSIKFIANRIINFHSSFLYIYKINGATINTRKMSSHY